MGVGLLLDSCIIIDHLNQIGDATGYLKSVRGDAAVSAITRAEVLCGTTAEHLDVTLRLLNSFPCLAVDAPVADLAARLRRSNKWKLPDAFQAALAQHHKMRLATRNSKDFDPGKFSFVVLPYVVPPAALSTR